MSKAEIDPETLDDKELKEYQARQKELKKLGQLAMQPNPDLSWETDEVHKLMDIMSKSNIRPEILAFAEAMEAEMRRHDAEKGDSWKDCDIRYLYQELESVFMGEIWQETPIEDIEAESYIKASLYAMMLYWRGKDDTNNA